MRSNRHAEPVCLKFHALSRWAQRQLGGIEHERRVASIASSLFDITGSFHGLQAHDLRLLRLAAIVHDVGRSIDEATHPEQGARMLREEASLPLTGSERRALCYLTQYHKGRVPAPHADNILRGKDDHDGLRMVLGLLRAADALDSRSVETPQLKFQLEGRRLRIHCMLEQGTPKARRIYTRRKKFRLLEDLLGCRVEIHIGRCKPMQLVA